MNDKYLKGLGTALLTPFKNGEVDYEAFAATVDWQVEAGTDFLVPLGTTGETPTLSESEKLQVLEVTLQHAKGRPVMAGVGTNSVQGTLANLRLLQDADAFLVVVPFYNKPPQRGLYQYFKTIAEAAPKPVILYNVPRPSLSIFIMFPAVPVPTSRPRLRWPWPGTSPTSRASRRRREISARLWRS